MNTRMLNSCWVGPYKERCASAVNVSRMGRAACLMFAVAFLTACGPDTRGFAEELLSADVAVSVDAMSSTVESAAPGRDPVREDYAIVAKYELLSGLDDLPDAGAADTVYCLERTGDRITACVFFPMNVSIPSGFSGFSSSIYGCAELTGVPGSFEIDVEDAECPQELVDWFSERSDQEPSPVSIRGFISSPGK